MTLKENNTKFYFLMKKFKLKRDMRHSVDEHEEKSCFIAIAPSSVDHIHILFTGIHAFGPIT